MASVIPLGYLDHKCVQELEKNKLTILINASSHSVHYYVKYLVYANLLHTNLSGATLSEAYHQSSCSIYGNQLNSRILWYILKRYC